MNNTFYYEARPCSSADLERWSCNVRKMTGLENVKFFPVVRFVERLNLLPGLDEFVLEICEDDEMMAEGLTLLNEKKIVVPQRTYLAANDNDGRARFTLAHELGHLFLHATSGLARIKTKPSAAYLNPEWQADSFASSLLMPAYLMRRGMTVSEVMGEFGVSSRAASVRLSRLKMI